MPPRKRPKQSAAAALASPEAAGPHDDSERPLPVAVRKEWGRTQRDTYFGQANASGSSRTVADLQISGLGDTTLQDCIDRLPVTHAKEKAVLASQHETRFPELWQRWRAGYSLLFYGYGSKRELLLQLGRSWTSDGACFAVEGQQPGLTARDVLVWAAAAAHGAKPAAYRAYSADDLLELLRRPDAARVYVIVHGIDGPGLRDPGAQAQLSRLAALPRCHLAASVDHVNAALLWSLQARDRFAWTWVHAPTLRPLTREVTAAGIPPLLLGRREEGAARGARVVLASLSRNARQVFRLLATCQLAPDGEHGMTFDRLFQQCREQFLVSNETLLSSFLTEFRDHDLVRTKRAPEGTDLLQLCFAPESLQQLLEEIDQMD